MGSTPNQSSALVTLRAHIPPSMRGPVWDQLIATLSEEEQFAWDQTASVYDQLFLCSAEGKYLAQRASEEGGYIKPEDVGFTDTAFRDLVIQLSTRKLTLNAFLHILEIYYGFDAVRAFVRTAAPETFSIPDGSEQVFKIDGKGPFTVTFHSSDFADFAAASAIEIAITLNRNFVALGAKALALPSLDTQTNLVYLTVYTASRGLKGSIESISGPLNFPTGKKIIPVNGYSAYVKTPGGEIDVVMPATSIVVARTPGVNCANVLGMAPISIVSAEFLNFTSDYLLWGSDPFWGSGAWGGSIGGNVILITTALPHGLAANDWVFVDGIQVPPTFGIPFAPNGLFQVAIIIDSTSFIIAFPGT